MGAFMYLFLLIFACRESSPVLQGIEEPEILNDITSASQNRTVEKKPKVYQKADGVYIDVFYLGGRSFSETRGILAEQFGDLTESMELPMNNGMKYQFEKGHIQVLEDEIYLIKVPLPEVMRRSQTFQIFGFPEQIDKYMITHKEYRVENQWEFRRFRLRRDSEKNEFVTHFEAWKWVPNER
jgi:hypothetical protein